MLADAGLDKEVFTSKLDSSQLDAGFTLILSRQQLDLFVHVMKKLTKAGYTAWEFAGKGPREVLSDELLLVLEAGRTEYCVKVIESLTGTLETLLVLGFWYLPNRMFVEMSFRG